MQLMRQVILMMIMNRVSLMVVMMRKMVVMMAMPLLRIKIEEEQGMEATSDSCKVEQIQCRSKLQ